MSIAAKSREVFRVLGEAMSVVPALGYKLAQDDDTASLGSLFEDTVSKYPHNTMLICENRQWTYSEFNAEVNQLARVLVSRGVSRGDTVALFMENRADYVLSMLALVKLGASASLVNNSLSGDALVHCLKATHARGCVVGAECSDVFAEVMGQLGWGEGQPLLWFADEEDDRVPDWAIDAGAEMFSTGQHNLDITRRITAGETALYIFTSGTTGLPKAALVSHRKILAAGHGIGRLGFRIKPGDRLYLCLPIYHITGMGPGLCGFLSAGGSIVLRRSFSASNFWPEIRKYQANCFIYVGELCRYLTMQPPCAEEKDNPLEKMLGNGLRPDVWDEFKTRFGVSRICEIYGSSEGNVSFLNILNKDKTIGAAFSKVALVKYDNENDEVLRDQNGRCIEVPMGEPGLLLGEINDKTRFEGYTDNTATEKKIVPDVLQEGDRWFNTGDLIKQIDVGFALGLKHFQFVDRTGDTFRWRAENVSTNEVAEVLNKHPQINMANVYGVEVPGAEGRAGMVAFALAPAARLDLQALEQLVDAELPGYARPVFLRIQRDMATTVTFKLLKGTLREQAYHLERMGDDEVYVRKPRSSHYERLDVAYYPTILDGSAGY
ncbi:long-chain-acyl-CoA synthetase [Kineobactrum sediminis]|uniref:long-chain-acyl-CoA synthetase n=1 Tax=Kineobactrum sediminis TaxID=1905677 RepID=UPI001589BA4D|nr:long-chain-acyl-CoA synthetase [Kineobactrum sediminis]